ncbi:hypothetical protein FQN54_001176 [Arachnomyces sp. PD_36]|nr:hypothetical protein FQN54_001176 [Arachnomyces sp. PD_36]
MTASSSTLPGTGEIDNKDDVKIPANDVRVTESISSGSISSPPRVSVSDEELRAVHRKLDYKLLLWYSFVYLIMRIDVTNVTNTAIINVEQGNGIKKELGGLTSQQWAWILSIF